MASIGSALLGIATGAANVINEDAEKDRAFMRKQKVKIADSRLVRQEKEYDARKAQWDQVQKYGKDRKGQYMHAWNIFKDDKQALRAANSGFFAQALNDIKDPGTFTPYDIGLVTDEEVRARYGDSSIAGKILGAFGNTKARRADVRSGQQKGRTMDMDALSLRADEALGLGEFTPVIETSTLISKEVGTDGQPKEVTTTQLDTNEVNTETADADSFFKIPNTAKQERDGDQIITTITDSNGNLVSSKATAIANYRTFTRPEVDLDKGIATWSVTQSDGTVETFAGSITDLPEEAQRGFQISNATYSKDLGGYTILERDKDTKELKATFLAVEDVPEGQDQSMVKWVSFNSSDPVTGEEVKKWVATELVGKGDNRRIVVIDAIQVTTTTQTSLTPQPSNADSRNRAFSKLAQARAGGGDIGDALAGFSDDQLRALAVDVSDEAIKMSKNPQFRDMNFGQIEQQAILRIVRAEALRQKLRAGKQE